MEKTLRELVSDLPTESLDLFVMHYEAGEVGGYLASGCSRSRATDRTVLDVHKTLCRCPRACLGFDNYGTRSHRASRHPAFVIETMAQDGTLDTAALYTEAVLALAERDGAGLPEPEVVVG